MWSLGTLFRVYICVFVLLLEMSGTYTLRNVTLVIDPSIVKANGKSKLRCTYDLEDETLTSVKWYRGIHEFCRYIPAENPKLKSFALPGITVDLAESSSTQVVLKNIDFTVAGIFSCEVTSEGVSFHTRTDSKSMVVVQLPEHPPEISVGREPLDYGDVLRANCSSYPSRPPADLKFVLNNITVNQTEPAALRHLRDYDWSDLQLELKLSFIHFTEGRLILQCIAQISSVYREVAELELQSLRNPVPARVSAPSASKARRISSEISYTMQLAAYCILASGIFIKTL